MAEIIARELTRAERQRRASRKAQRGFAKLIGSVVFGLIFAGATSVAAVELDPSVKTQAQQSYAMNMQHWDAFDR